MNKTVGKQNGFTLVEVLIGLIILAIGLLAVAGMQIIATRGGYSSNHLTQATTFAQDKLEQLKNFPFQNLASGQDQVTGTGTIFSRQYGVADITATIKMITVTVQWTDRGNHSIRFSTIRAK
jgi:type IV pilus assembly protein PilV